MLLFPKKIPPRLTGKMGNIYLLCRTPHSLTKDGLAFGISMLFGLSLKINVLRIYIFFSLPTSGSSNSIAISVLVSFKRERAGLWRIP